MRETEDAAHVKQAARIAKQALCMAFVLICGACSYPASDGAEPVVNSSTEQQPPWSTPPGITLVDLMDEQFSSQPVYLTTRLGTETGEPLYVPKGDDLSAWTCTQQCAEGYTPFLAPPDAEAFGAWSLSEVDGEQRQWMYYGKPLFERVAEPEPSGEDSANQSASTVLAPSQPVEALEASAAENEQPPDATAESGDGMTLALYGLERHLPRPPTITVEDLPVAGGQALVTTDRRTIYFYTGDTEVDQRACSEEPCFARWEAVEAPMMARAIGDFVPMQQPNGVVQWTYAGKPLYTYRGDFAPRQTNGANESDDWKVALLTRDYRPPDVMVAEVAGHGHFLATAHGKPLYNRLPFRYRFGGRNSFEGFIHNVYEEGKELGTSGCDAECLETWQPFPAPPGAQPTGYWEIFERPDGSTQWAYQGYALYTNALDEGPGDVTETDLYEPLIGTRARYDLADGVADNGVGKAAGLNWHLAKP